MKEVMLYTVTDGWGKKLAEGAKVRDSEVMAK